MKSKDAAPRDIVGSAGPVRPVPNPPAVAAPSSIATPLPACPRCGFKLDGCSDPWCVGISKPQVKFTQSAKDASKGEGWCDRCRVYHDDLRPNGPLETCPYKSTQSASGCSAAEQACIDIFRDFEGFEVRSETASVRRAWEIGMKLLHPTSTRSLDQC